MLSFINSEIFGRLLPIVLPIAGIYLAVVFRFSMFKAPIKKLKGLFKRREGAVSPFKAACVALAGTLGVGNIAGVAAAITAGGAGAVFWMWMSALFAMVIKYAEVVSAMKFRKGGRGGAPYYMENGLGSRRLGVIFAVIILFSTFGVGNIVQSSAAAEAIHGSFGISKLTVGIVFAAVTFFLVKGGIERIAGVSSVVIPVLSLGYIILSLVILSAKRDMIGEAFGSILREAFSGSSVVGGCFGFLFGRAIRYGTLRGMLSNEAGCGTAAFAHAAADNSPDDQGFFGVVEVFVDTILLCTVTALVILVTFPEGDCGQNGMKLAVEAYSILGKWGGDFVALSSAVYAAASVVCWSFYGTECLAYLGKGRSVSLVYLAAYSLTGIVGSVFAPSLVWELADISISVMALFNVGCLVLLWSRRSFRGKGRF